MNSPSRNDRCPCGSGKKYKNCCAEKSAFVTGSRSNGDGLRAGIDSVRQYLDAGQASYADMLCNELLKDFPNHAELHFFLGVALAMQNKTEAAIGAYEGAIRAKHDFFEALCNLGGLLSNLGRHAQAEQWLRRATLRNPKSAEAHTNLGVALRNQGKLEEAVACYKRALQVKPDFAGAYYNLGNALRDLEKLDEAIASYQRAIALEPNHAEARTNIGSVYNNLGSALRDSGRLYESLPWYRRAIELNPVNLEAHVNLAVALHYQGDIDASLASYRHALQIKPDSADVQLGHALLLLRMGNLAEGWPAYEYRWTKSDRVMRRDFPQPWWQGEILAGKSILLWGEQGIGDELMFAAMYAEIVAQSGRCVIECAAKLAPLFVRSFPDAHVVAKTDPPHPATLDRIDYQCAAGSLARWLRPRLDSFPAQAAILTPAPERVAYWKEKLAALGTGRKIGFSWRSSKMGGARPLYCTTLDQWGPIFSVPGVHFVNLQYDDCAAELNDARQRFGVPLHAFDEVDLFNDLDETAALNQALDLVITAPTSVSSLSALLGVPTWIMYYGASWDTHGTDHAPWFPSARYFNRRWNESWEQTVQTIAAEMVSPDRH